MRKAGILMPITSLPSPYGVGTLGKTAREFIDFLKKAGQTCWQILPICPTGYGDSPYQSFSSFAGNPYLIDLDELMEAGLLEAEEYQNENWGEDASRVDYGLLYQKRYEILKVACGRISGECQKRYEAFCEVQKDWLGDYGLYMAVKNHYDGKSWQEWPEELRRREPAAIAKIKEEEADAVDFWQKVQFLFFEQWNRMKAYAQANGIEIIGDIPIYVSGDSADVWSHPEQFQLDEDLRPKRVAGCPPDGFSATGQLWGNPLFDWDYMKEDGYSWWVRRIQYQSAIYDIIRIDHFRGFEAYFSIPAGDADACNGVWVQGPGMDLFRTIEEKLGKLPIIAEDLGFLTPGVKQLLEDTGFPGMKVLEFAFDSRDTGFGYKTHMYPRNCVVYCGTHDNEPVLGWVDQSLPEDLEKAVRYFRLNEEEGYNWGMMRSAWASVGDLAVMQMQDILGLGSESRMNTPSTMGSNWTWRCLPGDYNDELAEKLHEEMELYERLPQE